MSGEGLQGSRILDIESFDISGNAFTEPRQDFTGTDLDKSGDPEFRHFLHRSGPENWGADLPNEQFPYATFVAVWLPFDIGDDRSSGRTDGDGLKSFCQPVGRRRH